MKTPQKKEKGKNLKDDTLWGLLSPYKANHTYFRILVCEKDDSIVVQITDNPRNWLFNLDEKYKDHRQLKRSELDTLKLSTKYLSPEHLIKQIGPTLGIKIPDDDVKIINNLGIDGCFIIETALKFMPDIIQNIKKIINLSPQKKYELLEKFFAVNSGE